MSKTVRARFVNGRLEPADPLDLIEGTDVTITIVELPRPKDPQAIERFRRAAGSWKGTIDAEELIRNIYADRLINTRPEPKL